jgi:hypothetical protein
MKFLLILTAKTLFLKAGMYSYVILLFAISFFLFIRTILNLTERLSIIRGCIENIKHINSFMLMSINRCIDFTKASNGIKLVPRLETINLIEAVNAPLHCIKVFVINNTHFSATYIA